MEEREERFNMALATLKRMHTCLEQIRIIFQMTTGIQRQRLHIDLVKNFFQNASPLLDNDSNEYKSWAKEVDDFKIQTKVLKGRRVEFYDFKLEKRLFQIVRELETKLKRYFMPPAKDPGKAIEF